MNVRKLSIMVPLAVLCWTAAAKADDITTTDGRIYHNAIVQRAEPDGLVATYEPEPGGFGVAKLKFRNLPDSVRNQYNYNADKANTFETQQAQAALQWRPQPVTDSWFTKYQQIAELNRSLAGDSRVSYMIVMDPNGKVSLQGFTGNVLPFTSYYPGSAPFNPYAPSTYTGLVPVTNSNPAGPLP